MSSLAATAPAFVDMAHRIVWCTVTTVNKSKQPRSRILHPIWQWNGQELVGWIATSPTPTKRGHLDFSPFVSLNYWAPDHDTCLAECRATWHFDDETRRQVWDIFANGPAPVGYDPKIIPGWTSPTVDAFAVLRLEPYRLRVFPGSVLMGRGGEVLFWRQ